METKKNHFDLSLPHSIDSYIKSLVHHTKHPGKVYMSDSFIEESKNLIVVISKEGFFENASGSVKKLLGYSFEEIRTIPIKSILEEGDFNNSLKPTTFYFENTLNCKNKNTKRVKWRIVTDAFDDAFVFVGWEIII